MVHLRCHERFRGGALFWSVTNISTEDIQLDDRTVVRGRGVRELRVRSRSTAVSMPELPSWSSLCGGVLSGRGVLPVPSTADAVMGIVTGTAVVVAANSDAAVTGVGGGGAVCITAGSDAVVMGDGVGGGGAAGDGSGDDAAGESHILNKESRAFKFLTQKRPGDRSHSKRVLESDAASEIYLKRSQKQVKSEPETGAAAAADDKMPKVQVGEGGYKQGAESVSSQQERGSLAKMATEHVATAGRPFPLRIGRAKPEARVGSSHSGMQPGAALRTPGQMLMNAAVQAVLAVAVDTTTLYPVTAVYDPAHAEARMTALHELIFYNKSVVRTTTRAEGDYCKALHCTELEVLDVLKLRELVLEMIAINKDDIWPQNSPYGATWAVYCVLRQNGFKEPPGEKHLSPTPTSDMLWFKRYVFSQHGASTWAKFPDMDGCTEAPRLPALGGART